MNNTNGIVYLMGAGPGNVSHLTVEAQHILQKADVLIYDALVDEHLKTLLPTGCECIHVGKRGGQPSTQQSDINQLLVHYCQQQNDVVRLKSGDPFIFGRCTAEIEALNAANCDYVVVPGLSSALTAPLLAHIPLTDPVLSRTFTVLSAHDPDALNWSALAQLDTLVILMGTRKLGIIVDRLQDHGRSPQTPIAIIRWASQPQEQIWVGTLESILQKTSRQTLSPAVMVIGEVVNLRPYLQPKSTTLKRLDI